MTDPTRIRAPNTLVVLLAAVCLAVLAGEFTPWAFVDVLWSAIAVWPLVLLIVLALGILAFVTMYRFVRDVLRNGPRRPSWQFVIAMVLLFCTLTLLVYEVPKRTAFAMSRTAFEKFVDDATASEYGGNPLSRRLGFNYVDEFAAHPLGGVCFRVGQHGDRIDPDRVSYGFAYRPNSKGTPFGAARYRYFSLANDWYWFRVLDDHYLLP